MKLKNLKDLIKEEVRRVLHEETAQQFFQKLDKFFFKWFKVRLTPKFNVEAMAQFTGLPQETVKVLLFNLVDSRVIGDVAKGIYTSFDPHDSTQFNDEYDAVASKLGLGDTTQQSDHREMHANIRGSTHQLILQDDDGKLVDRAIANLEKLGVVVNLDQEEWNGFYLYVTATPKQMEAFVNAGWGPKKVKIYKLKA